MEPATKLEIGDLVVKNPKTHVPNDFNWWGRGLGIGEVVEPPFEMEDWEADVRWPAGRCFEEARQLIKVGKKS